jgi:hypothetical protein
MLRFSEVLEVTPGGLRDAGVAGRNLYTERAGNSAETSQTALAIAL